MEFPLLCNTIGQLESSKMFMHPNIRNIHKWNDFELVMFVISVQPEDDFYSSVGSILIYYLVCEDLNSPNVILFIIVQ